MAGVANTISGVDIDPNGRHWSLFSFHFPQCESLRLVNVRSAFRFKARSTPMRACIMKSRPSAAPIRQPIAVCHSSRFLLGLWQLHDVIGGVFEGDQLATAGEGDRVLEWTGPAKLHCAGGRRLIEMPSWAAFLSIVAVGRPRRLAMVSNDRDAAASSISSRCCLYDHVPIFRLPTRAIIFPSPSARARRIASLTCDQFFHKLVGGNDNGVGGMFQTVLIDIARH